MGKSKNKKPKNELVFDCKERENFLKGFSKRKKQRQKKAQEEIELKLKEERKRIKDESKNLKVECIFKVNFFNGNTIIISACNLIVYAILQGSGCILGTMTV